METVVREPSVAKDTYGDRAVGRNFNPSHDSVVDDIKTLYAEIINICDNVRKAANDPETQRLASIAITEAQGAQMWAVKAATWELP